MSETNIKGIHSPVLEHKIIATAKMKILPQFNYLLSEIPTHTKVVPKIRLCHYNILLKQLDR